MGALGARRVSELMVNAGLQPIELERYSRSNKIWATKVKRLRLPDLLCVRTGLRVEVRAKSKLTIKMSDAPTNPERRWNSGLVPEDMIAFILIRETQDGTLHAADNAELFMVESLIATEANSKLGSPKSGSEGAERDREWPSTVATCNGVVPHANAATQGVHDSSTRRPGDWISLIHQLLIQSSINGTDDFSSAAKFLKPFPHGCVGWQCISIFEDDVPKVHQMVCVKIE